MPLSRKNVLILDLKMSASSAFWALFFAVQLPVVHAKTLLGLRKLAAACKQTAKGVKASMLETIRGDYSVVLCVIKRCYWMETGLLYN